MSKPKATNKPLTDSQKQTQPLPAEMDPKNAKVQVFMAMQKVKRRFSLTK